jgi:2-amino-4-hydroxy-6-hydroxymethyldihydropteridine diphosphokinase
MSESAEVAHARSAGDEVVFVALGANLGDRVAAFAGAVAALEQHPDCVVLAATTPEETAPLGPADQPPYLNQMLALTTRLSPFALLDLLLELERRAGRVRAERWGPRTLDCDIVRFGDRVIRDPRLAVPHPELANRDFWLRELAELQQAPAVAIALGRAA